MPFGRAGDLFGQKRRKMDESCPDWKTDGNSSLWEERSPFQSKEIAMSRFRKLLLGAVAGVALVSALALVNQTEAGNRPYHVPQHHQPSSRYVPQHHQPSSRYERVVGAPYTVYFRRSPNVLWTTYGGYPSYQQAVEALNIVRASGYDGFTR
jgi:hypothetical protein